MPTCDQKVLDLIDQWAGQEEPFFIYYPTLAVHGPLLPTDEFKGKSGLGAYGDFVLQVDAFIGRLEAKLDEKGIADNTIVVFTSDNEMCIRDRSIRVRYRISLIQSVLLVLRNLCLS